MNRVLFIIPVSLSFFLYCCRTARTVQQPVPAKDTVIQPVTQPVIPAPDHAREDSLAFIRQTYQTVMNNRITYTTFAGKIDLDYKDADGKDYNVNAHIRMHKDSMIWLSVNAILGIEALRVRITKDSVKLLDKQNKIYTARPISYLQELTALPLELADLQDLLLGNPVFLDSSIHAYSRADNTISLYSRGSSFTNLFTVNDPGKWVLQCKLDDLDPQRKRSCYLTYGEYEDKKAVNFSTRRTIQINDRKRLTIKLDYKQYDFNEKLSFPFNIPKNYLQN